jgi:hypothetical protein
VFVKVFPLIADICPMVWRCKNVREVPAMVAVVGILVNNVSNKFHDVSGGKRVTLHSAASRAAGQYSSSLALPNLPAGTGNCPETISSTSSTSSNVRPRLANEDKNDLFKTEHLLLTLRL